MQVTVKQYTDLHELICLVHEPDDIAGKDINVDPFVNAMIIEDEKCREVGRSLVGKTFEMSDYYISTFGCYVPDVFEETTKSTEDK